MSGLSEESAIKLGESGFWKDMTYRERAGFQMFEERLCMPFAVFHEAVEKSLGRPVFTHEFGLNWGGLQDELLGEADPPSLQDILALIPEEKRIVVTLDESE